MIEDVGNESMIKYVDVVDIDDRVIKLPMDSSLYYEENDTFYTLRYGFNELYHDIENYMMSCYEVVDMSEFCKKELVSDKYEGKFVFKLVLKDGSIINHYYTFIGFEDSDVLKLVPVKIPLDNRYTVDPTLIQNYNWYYVESSVDENEYVELRDLL